MKTKKTSKIKQLKSKQYKINSLDLNTLFNNDVSSKN